MASLLTRKPYFSLTELCERWVVTEADIAAYVLERELTLSVPVAGLRVETSEKEEDAEGRPFMIPTGHRWIIGTVDLHCAAAWTVLHDGQLAVDRFYDLSGELLDPVDGNGEPYSLLVQRHALVVRHAEKERFEAVQGIATTATLVADGTAPSAQRFRGAPPKYDWVGFMAYMVTYIHCPGPPSTQAELLQVSRDWFEARLGPDAVPSDSSIKLRLNMFWDKVKPNVGRASAAKAIR